MVQPNPERSVKVCVGEIKRAKYTQFGVCLDGLEEAESRNNRIES